MHIILIVLFVRAIWMYWCTFETLSLLQHKFYLFLERLIEDFWLHTKNDLPRIIKLKHLKSLSFLMVKGFLLVFLILVEGMVEELRLLKVVSSNGFARMGEAEDDFWEIVFVKVEVGFWRSVLKEVLLSGRNEVFPSFQHHN